MRYLVLAAVLLAACGGSEGEAVEEQSRCIRYTPHPQTQPSVTREGCLPDEATGPDDYFFCWRSEDPADCAGATAQVIGCVVVEDRPEAAERRGRAFAVCVSEGECVTHGIDNPACCGFTHPDGLGAWSCD